MACLDARYVRSKDNFVSDEHINDSPKYLHSTATTSSSTSDSQPLILTNGSSTPSSQASGEIWAFGRTALPLIQDLQQNNAAVNLQDRNVFEFDRETKTWKKAE